MFMGSRVGASFFEFSKEIVPPGRIRTAALLLSVLLSASGRAASGSEIQPIDKEPTVSKAANNPAVTKPNEATFSLDILLSLESVDDIRVSSDSSIAAIDVIGAYANAASYQRPLLFGKDRSTLWLLDLENPTSPKRILSEYGFDAVWSGPFSPDGARLVVFWMETDQLGFGVYDLKEHHLLPLEGTPNLDSVFWLGKDAVVASLTPNNDPPLLFDINRETGRQLPDAWRAAVEGVSPTGQLLVWPPNDLSDAIGGIVAHYNLTDGTFTSLAAGAIETVTYSNDQQRVLLEVSGSPMSSNELYLISPDSDFSHTATPLAFFSEDDEKLGVDSSTLSFSPDGQEMLFQAYLTNENGEEGQGLFLAPIKGAKVGKARKVTKSKPQRAYFWGTDIIFAAQTPSGLDWRTQDAESKKQRRLTIPGSATAQLVASRSNGLYFLSNGDLFKVSKSGEVGRLASDPAASLKRWDEAWPYSFFFGMAPVAQAETYIPFIAEGGQDGPRLLVLDLDSGELRAAHQFKDYETLEFFDSETGETMLVRESRPHSPTRYKLSDFKNRRSGASENGVDHLLELNHSLEQIDVAISQTLRYEGLDGEELTARLLLPTGGIATAPFAMVVLIYPGPNIPYTDLKAGIDPGFSFFHEQTLPAYGYALLKPNIPLGGWEEQREPTPGMSDVVINAVQSATKTGVIDEDRVVLLGASYGGYSTQVILTQTDQFAGGISMAGFNNLSSLYGVMDIRQRFRHPAVQPDFFLANLAERGQLRMGAAPWQDPERYHRNSPIFSIDNIQDPLLLVHGDLDYVPIAQSEAMFTSMIRAKKPVQLLRYWGEGHTISSPANIRHAWEHILRWLESVTPNGASTAAN